MTDKASVIVGSKEGLPVFVEFGATSYATHPAGCPCVKCAKGRKAHAAFLRDPSKAVLVGDIYFVPSEKIRL